MSRQVLVIEDTRDISGLIEIHLRDLGCEVRLATDGLAGLSLALAKPWDLVILDLGLPGLDGLEILKRLRARPGYVPILMLTARGTELDKILGLELGADDYLSKPFHIRELLARVKALFRRVEALSAGSGTPSGRTVVSGGLSIDTEKREVRLSGRLVVLTGREFDLLLQFARTPGRVYTRSELLDLVWGYSHDGYEHTVNSHINRLRAKIETDPARPCHILTVWGIGYKFAEPGREGAE